MKCDNNFLGATFGLGQAQASAGSYAHLLAEQMRGMEPPLSPKLARAVAFLRSRGKYCLDVEQARITPKDDSTVLDRWRAGRKSIK